MEEPQLKISNHHRALRLVRTNASQVTNIFWHFGDTDIIPAGSISLSETNRILGLVNTALPEGIDSIDPSRPLPR